MTLRTKPVSPELQLAPFALISLEGPINGEINKGAVDDLLKDWTGSSAVDDVVKWPSAANDLKLLHKDEKDDTPFDVSSFYVGNHRWATVYEQQNSAIEVSVGIRVHHDTNLPTNAQIAKEVIGILPSLERKAKSWKPLTNFESEAELMISRHPSGIIILQPPSITGCLKHREVMSALFPIGVALLGGLLSLTYTPGSTADEVFSTIRSHLPGALILAALTYLVIVLLFFVSTRNKRKWGFKE